MSLLTIYLIGVLVTAIILAIQVSMDVKDTKTDYVFTLNDLLVIIGSSLLSWAVWLIVAYWELERHNIINPDKVIFTIKKKN